MNDHYPTIDEPATVDYVLTVLRDEHRQQCEYDGMADPDVSLSLRTTVADWREACDLVDPFELGRALNQDWGIDCSDAEWQAVLEPSERRPLSGVCELIARHATRHRVRPARLLGRNCASAGAFLTIRSLLRRAGADVTKVAPSTPLADYARRHADVFLQDVSRLVPGSLPPVRIRSSRLYEYGVGGFLAGWLALGVGCCSGLYVLTLAGLPLIAIGCMLTWIVSKYLPPVSVEFGELRTFRDLALVVADRESP
jgi:hypothetical protein